MNHLTILLIPSTAILELLKHVTVLNNTPVL